MRSVCIVRVCGGGAQLLECRVHVRVDVHRSVVRDVLGLRLAAQLLQCAVQCEFTGG